MPTLARPFTPDLVKNFVQEILKVTHRYGFNKSNGAELNIAIASEFEEELRVFMAAYVRHEERAVCTFRILDTLIYHSKRKPIQDRQARLWNELLNELTLVWMLVFIRYQYRGRAGLNDVLKALKILVAGLLRRYGYNVPTDSDLLKPSAVHWEEQELLWRILEGNIKGFNAAL
jgi:hypothetical protein